MKAIAVANHKGGVGKTTISVNLAACLGEYEGTSALVMDLDPQGHVALALGLDPCAAPQDLGEVLLGYAPLESAAQETKWPGLFVAASEEPTLSTAAEMLRAQLDGEQMLAKALADAPYDYVIMDCPPSLEILTRNALNAAEMVLVPVNPDRLSLEGLADIGGALIDPARIYPILNRVDGRAKTTKAWVDSQILCWASAPSHHPYNHIAKSEPINQASIAQAPVIYFSPRSAGARDFRILAADLARGAL